MLYEMFIPEITIEIIYDIQSYFSLCNFHKVEITKLAIYGEHEG